MRIERVRDGVKEQQVDEKGESAGENGCWTKNVWSEYHRWYNKQQIKGTNPSCTNISLLELKFVEHMHTINVDTRVCIYSCTPFTVIFAVSVNFVATCTSVGICMFNMLCFIVYKVNFDSNWPICIKWAATHPHWHTHAHTHTSVNTCAHTKCLSHEQHNKRPSHQTLCQPRTHTCIDLCQSICFVLGSHSILVCK